MKRQIVALLGYMLGAGVVFMLYLLVPSVIVVGPFFPSLWSKVLVALGILGLAECIVCYIMMQTTSRRKAAISQHEYREVRNPASSSSASWKRPYVSSIVLVSDEEPICRHCITSLLEQDYEPYEVVVIDFSTTGEIEDTLDEIAQAHPRGNKLWTLRLDQKTTPKEQLDKRHALLSGLQEAQGEWLLLLDVHTPYDSWTIRNAITKALDEETDLFYSDGIRLLHRKNLSPDWSVHSRKVFLELERYGS
ncbi:MAG TPA: glycosyltransferase family A protein [Ktedonobacteraceae bacterium]